MANNAQYTTGLLFMHDLVTRICDKTRRVTRRRTKNVFAVCGAAGDGFVTRDEFDKLFLAILPKAQPGSSARAFAALDKEGLGKVDIVSWTHRIRLADMPAMVARIRRHGEQQRGRGRGKAVQGSGQAVSGWLCSEQGASWRQQAIILHVYVPDIVPRMQCGTCNSVWMRVAL